jgi:outer membrane protein assembly factor BamB
MKIKGGEASPIAPRTPEKSFGLPRAQSGWFAGLLLAAVWGCSKGPTSSVHHPRTDPAHPPAFPSRLAAPVSSNDWYRWRGPEANGVSHETGWSPARLTAGPKPIWSASVGTGFSSLAVSQGRLLTLGNRDDTDTVYCLDANNGKTVWTYSYPCGLYGKDYEGGPNATPAVDGAVVYTLSKAADLFCLETDTGKLVWSENVAEKVGASPPKWGFAGSPLVEGDWVVVNVGRFGTALNKRTGQVVWTTGTSAPGYSTPVPFSFGGQPALAVFGSDSLAVLDLKSGRVLTRYPWPTSFGVNAADPVIAGDRIFLSSGYGSGCALIQLQKEGEPALLWKNKELGNHFNSSVRVGDAIYGIDGMAGDTDGPLKCLDLKTGEVAWSAPISGTGTLIAAGGKLIVLSGRGELLVAEATPEAFKPLARCQVLGGKCWTAPVLSHGKIYCRNARGKIVCLDVSK